MNNNSTSCKYIPTDIQKEGLSLIHGENISCIFEGKEEVIAVNHVDFSIEENKITAIIGESGSGKSTLLKLIYGLLEPNTGELRYRGWLVPTRKDKLIPGHDAMKLVSQGFDDLNLYAKVWDNIASQLSNTDLENKKNKTQAILEKLKIDHLAQHRVADLSGGEKQRVAISRALINEPEVLLMDEPFNQVDAAFRDSLQQDIRHIVEETGLTVVLVSHDPAEVLGMADALIVMRNGKIVDQGVPKDLYYSPNDPYTALLLAKSNILTPSQSPIFGLNTSTKVAVHQEWIDVTADQSGEFWIKEIRFRGFYSEYLVGNDSLSIRAIVKQSTPLAKNTKVNMTFSNYITF
ncbi:ABC transporter ATP-binding protein [Sphingobacterium pedocola]|uniref:ABC transporter ATP-binding protein n=1 Tax=Sphingobacterium pedocola TaxID=2082722 RepID=A0ABR9TA12_9SPHI|nr:ABC transporter ATP-binding protein [Sphingobacterium pedocola]MBE8722186.1 ABC transporter ATP-binding protein [Sphingobacterium pedocola]